MIKNERQYRIAAAEAGRFEKALLARDREPPNGSDIHPRMWAAEAEAIAAQLSDLRAELAAYEALRSGAQKVFTISDIGQLPQALVEARIASGLTQKELAARLGLPEQAIQRYEATDYAGASIERLREIADAIPLELTAVMSLPRELPDSARFFARMRELGLDRRIVLDRLLPPRLAQALDAGSAAKESLTGALIQAAAIVQKVLGIAANELFGEAPVRAVPIIAGGTRFKRSRRNVSSQRGAINGYTVFAQYLGLLVLQATAHLDRRPLPNSAAAWRDALLQDYGEISLESLLRFLWSFGVAVLPLRDSGQFHGACWRTEGRDIVVLKQRSTSAERWLFDGLHEGGHLAEAGDTESFAIIEDESLSLEPEEKRATEFAAAVALGPLADELAQEAVARANNDVRFLRKATIEVARHAGVPQGVLANYLAFRIAEDTAESAEQINWWGSASKLQTQSVDPWRLTRDMLLEHADFSSLTSEDRDLLIRCLSDTPDVVKA